MRILYLLLFSFTSTLAMAQSSGSVTPFKECPAFMIEYNVVNTEDGPRYSVSVPLDEHGWARTSYPDLLEDLNDLNQMSEFLYRFSKRFCPDLNLSGLANYTSCLTNNQDLTPLSEEFIDFSRNILANFDVETIDCKGLNELEALGDKIEKILSNEMKDHSNRLDFKILNKLFKGNETEIQMFSQCGGKKYSKNFVRNMILYYAKEQCIYPKPQGYLDFSDALEVAENISKDYDNKSIASLFLEMKDMTKDGLLQFTDKVMRQSVADVLGKKKSDPIIDDIIAKSEQYKYIKGKFDHTRKKIKYDGNKVSETDHLEKYLTGVYSMDVSFELVDHIYPVIVAEGIEGNLPSSWDATKKKEYIDKLMPELKEKYESCIQPYKEQVGYEDIGEMPTSSNIKDLNINDQKKLDRRNEMRKAYCQKYENTEYQCTPDNACNSHQGLFLDKPGKTETDLIQSCLYSGVYSIVDNVILDMVDISVESVQKDAKMDAAQIKELKNLTLSTLKDCLNLENAQVSNEKLFRSDDLSDPNMDILESLSSTRYTEQLTHCSNKAEDAAALYVVDKVIRNIDEIEKSFDYGDGYQPNMDDVTKDIINHSYHPCVSEQYKIVNKEKPGHLLENKDPMLCTPMIEIKAASVIVENTLKKKLIKNGILENRDDSNDYLYDFEICSQTAFSMAMDNLGNIKSSTPINNEEDANKYLDKNPLFFNCIIDVITSASDDIAKVEYEKFIDKLAKDLKDKDYALNFKKDVQHIVKACFKKALQDNGPWYSLRDKVNDSTFIDDITKKCTQEVEVFVAPKIIKNESIKNLLPLVEDNLLISNQKENQVGNALALAAYDLRKDYKLTLPKDIKPNEVIEWSLREALRVELANGGSTNDFLKKYEAIAQLNVMKQIHENIFDQFEKYAKKEHGDEFGEFRDAVSVSCANDLYNALKDEFKSGDTENPIKTQEILDKGNEYLAKGLKYLKQLGPDKYNNQMAEIKSFCSKSASYKDKSDILKTDAFDFMVRSYIYDETKASLNDNVEQTAIDALKGLGYSKSDATKMLSKPFPTGGTGDSSSKAIKTRYLLEQYKKSKAAVDKFINDPKKFDELVFKDKTVTRFTFQNVDTLITSKEEGAVDKFKQDVTLKVMEKLFEDKSKDGFASRFVESIVIGGIGSGGIDGAQKDAKGKGVDKAPWGLKNEAAFHAKKEIRKLWNRPSNYKDSIDSYLDWDGMSETQRNKLIESVYKNGFLPSAKGEAANTDQITKDITEHTESYKYPNGKTFTDKVTKYVEPKIESKVTAEGVENVMQWVAPIPTAIWKLF